MDLKNRFSTSFSKWEAEFFYTALKQVLSPTHFSGYFIKETQIKADLIHLVASFWLLLTLSSKLFEEIIYIHDDGLG